MNRGHRGTFVVPHKHQMLTRWPPHITTATPPTPSSATKITIYGCRKKLPGLIPDYGDEPATCRSDPAQSPFTLTNWCRVWRTSTRPSASAITWSMSL